MSNREKVVLVTGGAGYIGSHTVLELLNANKQVVVVDNFSNSHPESLARVEQITGRKVNWHECDLLDVSGLSKVFKQYNVESVIHFAGLKAVGESAALPLKYYMNNVSGTLNLLQVMEEFEVSNLVFSSSATVYGEPKSVPILEGFPTSASNPYGRSKLHLEEILRDYAASRPDWSITLLRYFNPIGAHASGKIGESPSGIPNNLLPYVSQVAVGKLEKLQVFGDDYATIDGTGVRDYIHVVDLALGHLAALEHQVGKKGIAVFNLGRGEGVSVMQIIKAFEEVSGVHIPHEIVSRRPGDVAECFADARLALEELGWQASRDLHTMISDCWRWQSENPDGYEQVEAHSQSKVIPFAGKA